MNAPIKLAQATTPGAAEMRTVKIEKPADGKAVLVQLSTNQTIKVDFSGIANEKIIIVRVGERAVILFDNGGTVTLDPFWDSLHRPLANLQIEVAPGQIISPVEFALKFPITTDQSILPAAGEGNDPQEAGANFDGYVIALIFTGPPLDLLPPEVLPGWEIIRDTAPLLDDEAPPLVITGFILGIVEEEQFFNGEEGQVVEPTDAGVGNEDPNDLDAASANPQASEDGNDTDTTDAAGNIAIDNITLHFEAELSTLVSGGLPPITYALIDPSLDLDPENDFVHDTAGNRVQSMGVDVIFNWVSDGVIEGRSNDASNRLIFTLTVDTVTGHLEFDLNDQLDHPFHSTDDGNDLVGMWEELLGLNLSSVIVITDADGPPINLGELPAPVVVINVIDDTPIIVGEPEIRIVDEDDIKTPWSLGTEPLDGAGDGSDTGGPGDVFPILPAYIAGSLGGLVSIGADLVPDDVAVFGFVDGVVATMTALGLYSKNDVQPATENGLSLFYTFETDGDFQILRAFEPDPDVVDPGSDPANPDLGDTGNPVFELRLNTLTGEYEFRLFDELIHVLPAGFPNGADENFFLRSGPDGSIEFLDFGSIIYAQDFDEDKIILDDQFIIYIRDDIPSADIDKNPLGIVQHDETPGVQGPSFSDPFDSDTNSNAVKALFANLETVDTVGNDSHVAGDTNGGVVGDGPIGYARSVLPIVVSVLGTEIGADAPPAINQFTLQIVGGDGADAGVTLTDGSHIELELFDNGTPGDPTDDLILGRVVDQLGAVDYSGQVAFAIAIQQDGRISVAQYLSLFHPVPGASHDETINLDGKINAVLTVMDSDGDTDTDYVEIGSHIRFDDDGPDVDVNDQVSEAERTALNLAFDELVQPDFGDDDTYDRANAPEVDDNNGGADDVDPGAPDQNYNQIPVVETAPDSGEAIGRLTTNITGGLGALFNVDVDFGADGPFPGPQPDDQVDTFTFDVTGTGQTNLVVTALDGTALETLTVAERTVFLVEVSPGVVEGRIRGDDGVLGGGDDFVAFRFTLLNPGDPTLAQIQVEQFLAIDHDASEPAGQQNPENPSLYDEQISLLMAPGSTLRLVLNTTATDGDLDTDSDSDFVTLINTSTSFVTIDDDGPANASATEPSGTLIHDETPGDDGDDDLALPQIALDTLFAFVTDKGDDPHVLGPIIGYAQDTFGISATFDPGTDGPKPDAGDPHYAFSLSEAGVFSGLQTTEGFDIDLFLEDYGAGGKFIVGRVDGGDDDGDAAFALFIDPTTGQVTVAHYLSIKHDDQGDPDEANDDGTEANDAKPGGLLDDEPDPVQQTLAEGTLFVDVILSDGDNDTIIGSTDVSEHIIFEDDGPTLNIFVSGSSPRSVLDFALDETVQPDGASAPGYDRENSPEVDDNNGGADDVDPGAADQIYNRIPVIETNPDADEAIGHQSTAAGELASLFFFGAPNYGADGPLDSETQDERTDTLSFVLSTDPAETTLVATALPGTSLATLTEVERTIWLVQVDALTIEGRIAGDDGVIGTGGDDFVAFRILLTSDDPATALMQVDQFLAIDHDLSEPEGSEDPEDPSLFDEQAILRLLGDNTLGLQLSSTVIDGDNDPFTTSTVLEIVGNETSFFPFDDDGPVLDIGLASGTVLDLDMDELIVEPTSTSDESGSIDPDVDDIDGVTTVDGTTPFGHIETDSGEVADLFTDGTADAGTDGEKVNEDDYKLELRTAGGTLVANAVVAADFTLLNAAFKGVATTLFVTDANNTTTDDRIYLFKISDTVIEGRADLDNNGTFDAGEVALRYTLDIANPADPILEVDQILAIDHPTTTDHDESVTLAIQGADHSLAGIGINRTATLTDGDDDTITDSATVNITSALTIEDDGPVETEITDVSGSLVHDETPGVDTDDVEDDVAPSLALDALFAGVLNKGNDPHVADLGGIPNPDDVIGYAQDTFNITTTAFDAGTDGPKEGDGDPEYALSISDDGVFSGLQTTEGTDIFLYDEAGIIVGRVGTEGGLDPDEADSNGLAAFALHIDPDTGLVTLVQYLSILHDDQGDPDEANDDGTEGNDAKPGGLLDDEPEPIQQTLASGTLFINVTQFDGDDDSTTASADISEQVIFQDDGPTLTVSVSTSGTSGILDFDLDETVQPDGAVDATYDRANAPEVDDNNGGADDVLNTATVDPTDYNRIPVIETAPSASEAIGHLSTTAGQLASLFFFGSANYGADGPLANNPQTARDDSLSLVLSSDLAQTNLVATALPGTSLATLTEAERTIYLVQVSPLIIEGRIAGDNGVIGTGGDDFVAFRILLTSDDPATALMQVDQFLAIDHDLSEEPDAAETPEDPSLFDEQVFLNLLGANTLGLQLTSTVIDGDNDPFTTSTVLELVDSTTSFFTFDDDGPVLDIDVARDDNEQPLELALLNLDETTDPEVDGERDGDDTYNASLIVPEVESTPGITPGDTDDVDGDGDPAAPHVFNQLPDPTGTDPIGRLITAPNAVANLFTVPAAADAGTDGQKSLGYDFVFDFNGDDPTDGIESTLSVTQPAADGNPDANNSGFDPYFDPTIHLFLEAGGTQIVGRIQSTTDGVYDFIALRITLNDPDNTILGDETITVEQYMAIDHGDDDNFFDTEALLNTVSEIQTIDLKLTATIVDGDDDTIEDVATTRLFDDFNSFVSIDDDGPTAPTLTAGDGVVHDETVGVQNTTPINDVPANNGDGNDVLGTTAITFNGLPTTVAALFALVPDAGDDLDVPGSSPLGYAASAAAIVNTVGGGFGTDGGAKAYALSLPPSTSPIYSGVRTTEGRDVFLYSILLGGITVILGRVATEASTTPGSDTPNAEGDVAFALTIDPVTGKVYVVQYLSLEQLSQATEGNSFTSYDEAVALASNALQVSVTYTDGDTDTASASFNVGGLIRFEDDGTIAINDLDSIGLSGTVEIIDSFGQLSQNNYSQVGNFNINNSHGATDGSSVGELMTGSSAADAGSNPPGADPWDYSDTSPFAEFFSEGGVLLSNILDDFVMSDGTVIDTAAERDQIFQGSAFESLPKEISSGGTVSFDWSFRSKEPEGGDNDFAFWTLYKVTGTINPGTGLLNPGATYLYVDAGLIFDVDALYSDDLNGGAAGTPYARVDVDGDGIVDNADTIGGSALTSWEFGLPYSPTGLAWVNTVPDVKTAQSSNPGDAQTQGFAVHGDIDPNDTFFSITVPSDGIYVLRFGVVDYGNDDANKPSQLNIDRIRTTTVIDLDSEGNVLLGTTDEGSSGGVDNLSVDGTRVSQIAFDRDHDGVIEDGNNGSGQDEVIDIPVGGDTGTFDARFGTFFMDDQGDYLYDGDTNTDDELEAAFPGATVYDEVFRYTAVDGDGDTSIALLTVRIDATGGDRSGADNYIGSLFGDTFDAGGGNDILNGRGGGDILIGGAGNDTINTGAADDDVQDIIRYNAATDFGTTGDIVNNFDTTGASFAVEDRIEFGGALNVAYDDVINDDNFTFASGDGVNGGATAANLAVVEALYLAGASGEGVTNANLGNATAVAAEFNSEFAISGAGDALLVINDTDANSFAVWQYVEAGTAEVQAGELTLVGIFNGNGAVETGNLDLVT